MEGPPQRLVIKRNLYAHTNPVYLKIDDHPNDAREDARYLLKWIDRLEKDLNQRNRLHTGSKHVRLLLDTARQFYQQIIEE